jgi:AcrR family transcriptional regulator
VHETRKRILDVSEELFRRQGFTGTGIKEILVHASAPFGSLYHHFPGGKDELAAEAITYAGRAYAAHVADHLSRHDDPVVSIQAMFESAGKTLRDTDFADACPIETIALEVASTNESLRAATADVFRSWLVGLEQWLRSSGVADELAGDLAVAILSMLEGAFVLARSMRETQVLSACGTAAATLVGTSLVRS